MKHTAAIRLLCLLLCVLFLTGCGKEPVVSSGSQTENEFGSIPETSTAETVTAQATGSQTFAMPINTAYGWDPYNCVGMENQAVMDLIYEGLFTMNEAFDAEPVLCSEYTVTDDGLIYTLTIRDASFSDGRKLTADDVYYSMTKAEESTLYDARFRDVNSYAVTDPNTITIYMANPNDRLPAMLDFPIVPNFSATASALGTGPFVRSGNTALTLNRHWWQGTENLGIDSITLYSSASAEDTRDNFEIDTIHFVHNDPLSLSAATYHCDYELWNSPGTTMQYIGFNTTEGVFQDNSMRSAVLKAIDRDEIAEKIYRNYADAAVLPVSPESSMYIEELAREYTYNRDEALSELMASGSFYLPDEHPVVTGEIYDEDFDLETFASIVRGEAVEEEEEPEDTEETEPAEEDAKEDEEAPEEAVPVFADTTPYNRITLLVMEGSSYRSQAAQAVVDNLTEVGFTVTLKELDYSNFIYAINNQKEEWDLYYVDVSLTPDFDIRSILYPGNKLHYSNIPEDSTLRSLYYSALENSGNRYDLYEYLMEKAYICPVLFQNTAVFTARGVFTGLKPACGNLFYGITNIAVNN